MTKIQVWENVNFEGNSLIATDSIPNLAEVGDGQKNNSISSFKVESGRWKLWSEPNFSGVSIEAGPGDYADIRQIYPDFNDVASSIQVLIG